MEGCRAGKLKFTWADLNWIFLLPFWSWMWMFWLEVFQFQTITHPSHPIPSSRRAELQPSSSLLFLPRHVALGVSGVRGCNKVGKYGHLCSVLWVLWKIPMHSGNSSLDVNEAFSGSEVFAFPCGISPLHSSAGKSICKDGEQYTCTYIKPSGGCTSKLVLHSQAYRVSLRASCTC